MQTSSTTGAAVFFVFVIFVVVVGRRRSDGHVDGLLSGRRLRRRLHSLDRGRLQLMNAAGTVVMRKVRVGPAAVVVLGHGQRAEIERLLVGRSGRGDVARRPSSGQKTTDPVVLLQDHGSGGCGSGCGGRLFFRRRRVVVVVVLAAVVVVVVQVVEFVQVPVELESGRIELVHEFGGFVVVDPAVLGAVGRGQPEPFSTAGHRG